MAQAVLLVLEARDLAVNATPRAHILSCSDVARLEHWVRQVVTVKAAAALFAAPKHPAKARR